MLTCSGAKVRPDDVRWVLSELDLCGRVVLISGGRLAYFYSITSPLTLFASKDELDKAQETVAETDKRIKEAKQQGKGFWVDSAFKSKYDKAKQCECRAARSARSWCWCRRLASLPSA